MSRIDHILLALALAGLLLGAAVMVTPVRAETAPIALDRFLNGFERSCEFNPEYRRFVDTMLRSVVTSDGDGRGYELTGQTVIPAAIRPAIGRAELSPQGETTLVTVPVRGTYRGLPVRALHITRGNGVAVSADAVVFDVPHARVQRTLGAMVARSERQRRIRDSRSDSESTELRLHETDGASQLECYFAF